MTVLDLIGWAGAFFLLLGFTLNLFRIIDAGSRWYLFLNASSSGLLLHNAWMNDAFPFVVVNAVWMIFSLVKLTQSLLN